jgi:hypothetical protein
MQTIKPDDLEDREVVVMLDADGEPTDDPSEAKTIETLDTTYDGAETRTYFVPDTASS